MKPILATLLILFMCTLTGLAALAKTWPAGKQYDLQSSRFKWAYYEDKTRAMMLCNGNGSVKEYFGVSPTLFDDFMNARIKGPVFISRIEGKFRSAKVWVKQPRP